jgi:hypothetical protein
LQCPWIQLFSWWTPCGWYFERIRGSLWYTAITWNNIGEDGVRAVGEMLKHNTGLQMLRLQSHDLEVMEIVRHDDER